MRRIHQRGHEIGLHSSTNTCHNPSAIASEAARLQRIATDEGIQQPEWGGRMHFLRWQWPTTAHGWEQAGFHYDSTLSYADRPGFRCGTCHAYPMFDPVAQRQLQLTQQLQQRCRAVGGQFTLLWHNSLFTRAADRELHRETLLS